MERHHTNVSIAYAVLATAGAFNRSPDDEGRLCVGVLARAPGDGAVHIAREMAQALGMTLVEVRCPNIEYHPGAINAVAYDQVETAVGMGKPVLIVLDEAQSAAGGVLEALASAIQKRVEEQPVAVLAITTMAGERNVADRLAEGLGWDAGRIAMHRTDEENRRLLEGVLAAN